MDRDLQAYRSYVCPECFNRLDKCSCEFFPPYSLIFIDCGIQEQVRILNEKGYKTIGCCESHYNGVCDNIYVAFGKDWDFQCMPEGFRYNQRRRMLIHDYKRYISESDFRREKEQYLAALLEWCREL